MSEQVPESKTVINLSRELCEYWGINYEKLMAVLFEDVSFSANKGDQSFHLNL